MTGGSGGAVGGGGSEGGTFCRFTVGRVGTAAAHLRYISRESAVLERERGVLLHHVPEAVWSGSASTYAALRDSLIAYAWGREAAEGKRGRTHYRLLVSCEHEIATARLHGLLVAWLEEAVPQARAMGFVHRDTAHPHAHLFIEARSVDGRQLDFSARAWRGLDEVWNRLYARHLGCDEREHLVKKEQTRHYKRRAQRRPSLPQETGQERGQETPARPPRAARALSPAQYRERDRRVAGAGDIAPDTRGNQDGLDQRRTGGDQRAAAARASPAHGPERAPSPAEPAARLLPASRDAADAAAERALSETMRLREDLARVSGEQQRAATAAAVHAREARQAERQIERDEGDELEKGR